MFRIEGFDPSLPPASAFTIPEYTVHNHQGAYEENSFNASSILWVNSELMHVLEKCDIIAEIYVSACMPYTYAYTTCISCIANC